MEFENTSEMLDFLNASTEPDHYLSVSAASATVMVEKPRELAALKLRRDVGDELTLELLTSVESPHLYEVKACGQIIYRFKIESDTSPLQDDTALKTVGEVFQNCVRTLEAEGWVCMSYVCKECPGMESHLRYLLKDIGEPVAGDTASKPHHHGDELDNAGAKKSHAQHHEPCCDDKTEYEKQLDWILAMQSLAMFQEYSPPVHTTEPAAIMNQHMTAMDVQQTTQLTPEDEYAMSCFLLHQPNDACQQLPAIDFMCQAVQIEADFRPFILSNEEPMFAGM